ncbi:MAG: T9SS type A sorting domain-containing protein [Bacteroidota bacterium]
MVRLVFLFITFIVSSIQLYSATLTVCSSGCDYSTIAAAITAATAGDIIDIQVGTYTEAALTISKDLTIQGQGPSSTIVQAAATRDAASDGVFIINEGYTVTIKDLTVQNGNTDPDNGSSDLSDGGGIWIRMNSSSNITLANLTITNNYADDDGGGVYTVGGQDAILNMIDCVITNNEANASYAFAAGGGICNRGADVFNLTRCTIVNNHAGVDGGGLYSSEGSSTTIVTNCTIAENTIGIEAMNNETEGAGVHHLGSGTSIAFINCTIVENSMTGGGNGYGGGIYFSSGSALDLVNTIVVNNTTKGAGTVGRQVYIGVDIPGATQTTSLVSDCYAVRAEDCPDFSYTSAANIATTPSSCGLQTYYDVTGSEAASNATAPGGNIPTDDLCGTARGETHDIGAANVAFLPVELLGFSGEMTSSGATLKWQTATEENNQGFTVEHSSDSKTWTGIGFVSGAGTSTQSQDYTFLDDAPSKGVNYYRLQQIDYDGSYEYSNIIALRYEGSDAEHKLLVFPNPATDILNYRLSDLTAVQSVQLLDLFGKQVKSVPITNGQLSLADVPSGSYILCVDTGTQMWQQLVVKQ